MQAKINGFSERSKIPDIAGAVDDAHVPIKAPKTNPEDYFNHKHFCSYVLQGVVGSTGLFYLSQLVIPGVCMMQGS